jgi:Cu+-exporting ATPase
LTVAAGDAAIAMMDGPVVDDLVLLDPVCGMTVDRADARHLATHEGVVYAFCSIGCRSRFVREPAAFVSAPAAAPEVPPAAMS